MSATSAEVKRSWIDPSDPQLSIAAQCRLAGLARSTFHHPPQGESELNLALMRRIDEQYTHTPFFRAPKMTAWLRSQGQAVNHKGVARLMQRMRLAAVAPGPWTSTPAPGHRVYPYLLRGVVVERPNQVWSTDITYIPLQLGFAFLVTVLDWYSRYVLAWELSVTLDTSFCLSALEWSLQRATPEIFNSDQGAQFTSHAFTSRLQAAGVQISMDGRGRALDNVFVERLWRSVKYEEVYLHDYQPPQDALTGLGRYLTFYNTERPHQALDYRTPAGVYFAGSL